MKLDTNLFPVSMVELEHKKILVGTIKPKRPRART
jgi:hypothetical protein